MSDQQLPTFTIWILSLKCELLSCGVFFTSCLQFHVGKQWFCCWWWLHRGHWGCPLAALLPGPEGGGSVSQTGFWDLAKTNTALDFVPHFGRDAGDLGSLLQISLNILKTDEDNWWFLASISSITLQYTFCQQKWDVMLKSISPATAGHIKTVTHGSLCHCCLPLQTEMLHDFRQTSLQTVQWVLILSFELPAI